MVERNFSVTNRDAYLQILGMRRFPSSPEEIPNKVCLPPEALGDFEQAILLEQTCRRERSQFVSWDPRQQRFKNGKLFEGDESEASLLCHLYLLGYSLTGFTPLVFFHTHVRDNWWFSTADIAVAVRKQSAGYIFMVGSSVMVSAIFRTEKSTMISSSFKSIEAKLAEGDYYDSGGRMAKLLQQLGFGYYFWISPRGRLFWSDMKDGLELVKACPK